MLKKKNLLKKQKEFDRVFKQSKHSSFDKFLGIKTATNKNLDNFRVGIIVNSKVSKKAVVRNKIKRRIKAVLREELPRLSEDYECVIIVLPPARDLSFRQLKENILNKLEKLNCLNK